jgi:exodeoxyribonuclease V alpha subunit
MVDLALMSKLVQAIPSNARLILLGDKDQLASVEAGSVLGDICDTGRIHGFSQKFSERFEQITGDRIEINSNSSNEPEIQDCIVQLDRSYRFGIDSGIGTVSQAINKGDGSLALSLLKINDYDDARWKGLPRPSTLHKSLRDTVIQGYRSYLEISDPMEIFRLFEQFRVMCVLREGPYGVSALNLLVEQILREANLITIEKRWYRGRPVLITRNDYNLGLYNGDIGIILPDPAANNDLRAFFLSPDGTLRRFLPARLPVHETAYAITVHKSQGSEFDETLLLLPDRYVPILTRELIYTGITRARKSVEVWGIESVFLPGTWHFSISCLSDTLCVG